MSQLLYRLGVASARRGWFTITAWIVVLAGVGVVALTGMKFGDGEFTIPGTESSQAMQTLKDEFGMSATAEKADDGSRSGSLQLVVQTQDGTITGADGAAALAGAREDLAGLAHVTTVSDPLDPAAPYVSPSGTTAVVEVSFSGITDDNAEGVHDQVVAVADTLRDEGYTAEVGGSIANEVPQILGPTEVVGAVVAFVVLVLTFGSLAAAGANMLGALVGVGVGILGLLALSAVHPIGAITPVLAVMLGLAVGIDYCLFILARFRSELAEGRTTLEAIGRAVATAGSAVVFAGLTVMIALAGLAVVGIPFITEMGLAAALAVFVAVLMALTLLPALAGFLGRRALPKRQRLEVTSSGGAQHVADTATGTRRGFLTRWIEFVVRRPVRSGVAAVLVLGTVAVPFLSISTTLNIPGGEDPDSTQRAAYEIVAEEFGDGAQSPLVVLVEGRDVQSRLADVEGELADLDDVALVMPGQVSSSGDAALVTVIATTGPLDADTQDLVAAIRDVDEPDGVSVSVTGGTAIGIDTDTQLREALVTYILVIVGLSIVLLIIMFRSILVPLIATVGYLLSLGAGLGASVAVFQWGWLDPVFQAPQGNPLLSLLPIILTGILFGLAMDYQVFLVSRMHEAHAHGASPKEAIISGFRRSSVVVVAAASIMAAVFGGFALSHSSLVGSIALGLTVGVIADAFLVRMIVVPACLALLGKAAWWMPKWLDRILPNVDTEGRAFESTTETQPEKEYQPEAAMTAR